MRHQYIAELTKDGKPTGTFHYVEARDGFVYPIGYCAGWQPWMDGPVANSHVSEAVLAQERARLAPFKGKFHTHGHATEEEARACYKSYLLDLHARFDHALEGEQRKCQVCGAWTDRLASAGLIHVVLCPLHCNRESFEQFIPLTGESWIS